MKKTILKYENDNSVGVVVGEDIYKMLYKIDKKQEVLDVKKTETRLKSGMIKVPYGNYKLSIVKEGEF